MEHLHILKMNLRDYFENKILQYVDHMNKKSAAPHIDMEGELLEQAIETVSLHIDTDVDDYIWDFLYIKGLLK